MIARAMVAISITIMVCDAQGMTVLFDVDESASAITSVTPEEPLDDFVTGDFEFDRLNFSGGSVISANDPITFNNAFNHTTTIAPLVEASVTATSTLTYADLSFDIVTGSTQNGASPSDQSWSASSDVTLQANGTISVTGLGDVTFSINTTKTATTSGATLLNTSDLVSLSADASGTTLGIPFETALPLNIEASDVTLNGNLAGFVGPVKDLIINQINNQSATVNGNVVARSSDSLDIPEQVSFEIVQSQSVANISTAGGLTASSNLQGTLEGLRNTTSVRIDSSSEQQFSPNFQLNTPSQVIGTVNGVTLSSSVDSLDMRIKYGIVSEIIQDGSSPELVQLMIDMFEIELAGGIGLVAPFGNDTGNYVITGTIDPFLLPLSGAQPISLYTDSQYEYLKIPFDTAIDLDFLLNLATLDIDITDIGLLSSGALGDFLLNTLLTADLLPESSESFSLQGEVVARRKISDVPIPSTLLIFGLGFAGFAAWRYRAEKIYKS